MRGIGTICTPRNNKTERVGAILAVTHCCAAVILMPSGGEGTTARVAPTCWMHKSFTFTQNDCKKYHPTAPHTNLCFPRKTPSDFVIFPEFVLDNLGGV